MDFNVRQFNGLTGSPAKSMKRCRKNHKHKHYRACDYADDDDTDDADDNDDVCDDDEGPARSYKALHSNFPWISAGLK